jgi:hypothetical protein
MTMDRLTELLQLTLSDPRAAARHIIALRLPANFGWTALVLMAILSGGLGYVAYLASPVEDDALMSAMVGNPLRAAVIQIIVLMLSGWLAFVVGRAFGGQGRLEDALVLVAWVQVPLLALQVVQLVLGVAAPLLAPLVGLAGLALYAVLLSSVIAELHGFRSALKVFFGILGTSVAAALVASILLVMLGVQPHV